MNRSPLPLARQRARGPMVEDDRVIFTFPDPSGELAAVKLAQEIERPRLGPPFDPPGESGMWTLEWPRPNADRLEYQLELTSKEGATHLVCDPANPVRAPGPFGDKSVIEFPGYEPPEWLHSGEWGFGSIESFVVSSRAIRAKVPVILWTSPGVEPDEPLPLLVAHDGPEYAEYSGLLLYLERMIQRDRLPRLRAALLQPVDRDQTYSSSAAYARALAYEILPAVDKRSPTPHGRKWRVGMGASLGALALLHAHRRSPALFGGLFLQSGSYFRQRYDKQEGGFVRFRRISRFMGRVLTTEQWAHPVPISMSCGTVEENLANNRATRDALTRQGYDVFWCENRDGHNWVGWRDTFDPCLTHLLRSVWM